MDKFELRNKEIIKKIKAGNSYEQLAQEYRVSISSISSIFKQYSRFKDCCLNIENLKSKNIITKETKLYDLCKLLKFETRSINNLVRRHIVSIEQLVVLNDEQIYTLRNVGKLTKAYIEECLSNYKNNEDKYLQPYDNEDIILENFNTNINCYMLESTDECNMENINYPLNDERIQCAKANREYIWKLIDLVDDGQLSYSFLKKELDKEFDRIEKNNEQLIEMLSQLRQGEILYNED